MAQIKQEDQKAALKSAQLKKMNAKGAEKPPTMLEQFEGLMKDIGDAALNLIRFEDPTDLIPAKKLATIAAAVLGGSSKEAEAAILPGGRRDLFITHGFSPRNVAQLLADADAVPMNPQMHVMSYAIEKNPKRPLFGSATLVPKPDAVDPGKSSLVELRNRDFYTETFDPGRDIVDLYLSSRKGKFQQSIPNMDQALAIEKSPRFSSLAEYEASPHGAGALDRPVKQTEGIGYFLRDIRLKGASPEETLLNIKRRIEEGAGDPTDRNAKYLRAYMKRLDNQGSDYAEGKVNKPLPLNSRAFLAAIMSKPEQEQFKNTVNRLEKSGIEVRSTLDWLNADQLMAAKRYADMRTSELMNIKQEKPFRFSGEVPFAKAEFEAFKNSVDVAAGPEWNRPFIMPMYHPSEQEAYLNAVHEELVQSFLRSPSFNAHTKALQNITEEYLER